MEPRSLDRGNSGSAAKAGSSRTSFNGAAVSRPRKLGNLGGRRRDVPGSFNGAAVSRPRKQSWPDTRELFDGMLQWSRGLSTAETKPVQFEESNVILLQWSRGLSTAETSLSVTRTRRSISGFNGAAVSRPRKHVLEAQVVGKGRGLQWSRGLSTAETVANDEASATTLALQWSRGLSTAET